MKSRIERGCLIFALGLSAASVLPRNADARVVAFVVEGRQAFVGGVAWDSAGPYERLTGTAYMEVDPRDPLNAIIVDVERAPRNGRGLVEFSTPFFILKPLDMSRGNQKIFYTVNNRGNDSLIPATTVAQVGSNDVYLKAGYTIVDAGWEGDVLQTQVNLAANLPLAGTYTLTLEGNASFRSYETADANTAHSVLTVRDDVDSPKVAIASDHWAFGKCPTGRASLVPSTFDIC